MSIFDPKIFDKGIFDNGADTEVLLVDTYSESSTEWIKMGTTPYVDDIDYPTNYVYSSAHGQTVGNFEFESTDKMRTLAGATIAIRCRKEEGAGDIDVYIDPGTGFVLAGTITPDEDWAIKELDVSAVLDTKEKINVAKVYLDHQIGA